MATWLATEAVAPEALVPPQLAGFAAAVVWMVIGSLMPSLRPVARRQAAAR
jgi:hypothetical protein